MANTGGFIAHLVKLIVMILCIKYLGDAYTTLTLRAYQIYIIHSIIGLFRFGSNGGIIVKRSFRKFYDIFSNIVEIIPFAILSNEISCKCHVDDLLRQSLLLILTTLPLVYEIMPKKERQMTKKLLNHTINLQLLIILFVCLNNGSFSCINFILAYVFNRYFVETLCDSFDIPYDDLSQYSLSFVAIFSLTTLKELTN